MAPVLVLSGLGKKFGEFVAVRDVSLEVGEGEVFGLLGPNGAGKTTLTRMLCGLLTPSEGQATVLGMDVATAGAALRQAVGLLTEQPGLYDRLSGWENLVYFGELYGVDPKDAARRSEEYLTRFGLWERRFDLAGTYSKGMRQKLAIARALLHAPRVVFLDEPTSGLDPTAARSVRDIVAELARDGRTIVLASHNLDEVERLCARVAVIKQRVLALAKVSELRRGRAQADVELGQDAQGLVSALDGCPGVSRVTPTGRTLTLELAAADDVSEAIARLVRAGALVRAVKPEKRALEDVYLELVGTPGVG
jgi:ABC-2 type transport system ATP-binding protein